MPAGWRKKLVAAQTAHFIGTAVSCCLLALVYYNPPLLNDLRLKSFDLLLRTFPAPISAQPVVIVDIDTKSLAEYGQWPWSRSLTAELISKVAAARPAVIGLDIVFGESDRTAPRRLAKASPPLVREYLDSLPDPDDIFAETLRSSPAPVILGHLFTYHDMEAGQEEERLDREMTAPAKGSFALLGRNPAPFLRRFNRADLNLPVLERNAQGSGFFNIVPDADAIVRRLPLLASLERQPWPGLTHAVFHAAAGARSCLPLLSAFEQPLHPGLAFALLQNAYAVLRTAAMLTGEPYPSLVLAMLQAATGGAPVTVISNRENGVRLVQAGPYQIPVSHQGEMIVRFSRRTGGIDMFHPERRLRYLSAADVLDSEFDPALLKNAYVLVGTSALGLFDLISVPTSTVFPGVEFHGHALNTVLTGSFLDRPDWLMGLELLQIACTGLLLTLLLPRLGAAEGVLLALAVILSNFALSLGSVWLFHLMTDLVTPTATALLIFTALTFFNFFVEEKKARRLRSVFSQYLAPAVVEEMVKQQDSLVLSGEERELTILFSDIRGFTSMAEKMRPQALCAFLNEYLTPMTAAVMNRRGTVDKFIGDALMAFWNAPLPTPDHTRQACEAALAMLKELKLLNSSWLKRGLPTLRIGIGIHCGVVRVGNMGSKQRFEYTVIGDSVNLASRLEGLTKFYNAEILVSGPVCDALHKDFIFRQVDTVRVQGKTEPVTVCQLLDRRSAAAARIEEELQCWHEAFAYYSIGDFLAAELLLRHLADHQPEDSLYSMYLKRCERLAAAPPAHWEGITDLRSK